jgi:hypothetical protein
MNCFIEWIYDIAIDPVDDDLRSHTYTKSDRDESLRHPLDETQRKTLIPWSHQEDRASMRGEDSWDVSFEDIRLDDVMGDWLCHTGEETLVARHDNRELRYVRELSVEIEESIESLDLHSEDIISETPEKYDSWTLSQGEDCLLEPIILYSVVDHRDLIRIDADGNELGLYFFGSSDDGVYFFCGVLLDCDDIMERSLSFEVCLSDDAQLSHLVEDLLALRLDESRSWNRLDKSDSRRSKVWYYWSSKSHKCEWRIGCPLDDIAVEDGPTLLQERVEKEDIVHPSKVHGRIHEHMFRIETADSYIVFTELGDDEIVDIVGSSADLLVIVDIGDFHSFRLWGLTAKNNQESVSWCEKVNLSDTTLWLSEDYGELWENSKFGIGMDANLLI